MSEWSIEHAWKAILPSITKRHRDTSLRNPFNNLPVQTCGTSLAARIVHDHAGDDQAGLGGYDGGGYFWGSAARPAAAHPGGGPGRNEGRKAWIENGRLIQEFR